MQQDERRIRLCTKTELDRKERFLFRGKGLTREETSKVLKAFNPEYIKVTYPDAMSGTDETRTFYVGDRSAPVKIWTIGNKRYESISFDLIER